LVEIFAVVGDLANRRVCRRRDFHQVESPLARHLDRFERLHDAKLRAFFIDHPDFAGPNPLVDTDSVALPEVAFCDNSPLPTVRRLVFPVCPELARLTRDPDPVGATTLTHIAKKCQRTGFKV
jgi:hypothetical protein